MTEIKITFRTNGEKTYVVDQQSSMLGFEMADKKKGDFFLLSDASSKQPVLINMGEVVTIEFSEVSREWA